MAQLRDLYNHHKKHNEVLFSLSSQGNKVWFGIVGGPKKGLWLVEYGKSEQPLEWADWDMFGCSDPKDWTECFTLVCAVFSKLTGVATHINQLHDEIAIEMVP